MSDPEVAQDLTQDVFESAYENPHQIRDRQKVKSWVMAIAANKVRQWYNVKKKREKLLASLDQIPGDGISGSGVSEDLSALLEQEERKSHLRELLWKLDLQLREILSQNLLLGIPLKTIANDMDINYNTLRSKKGRVLKYLKEELEKLEGEDEDGS